MDTQPHMIDELIFGHLTRTDEYKEMKGLNLDPESNLEAENTVTWPLESHGHEVDSRSLLVKTQNGDAVLLEVEGFMARENSIDGKENITQYNTSPSESGGIEERRDLYPDTLAVDCEIPELAVFLHESNYQIVRDICIDRIVPSQDSCSVENCELDHNIISCFLNSYVDINSNFTKEALDTMSSLSNGLQTFSEDKCFKVAMKQSNSGNLMIKGKVHFDTSAEVADDGSANNVTERPILARELDYNHSHLQLSNATGNYQVLRAGTVLANSMPSSTTVALQKNSHEVEAAPKSEVESRSITHDCDSLLTTLSSGEVNTDNADCQLPFKTENMLEESMLESSSVSRQNLHDHGDSSSSAVGLLSGPIVYSGSISLRSNSSTASTRSFAFPVLPSEWNESPVKMVEVDRKRKRKNWRMACLCSKF